MKINSKIFLIVFILMIFLLCLTGCNNNNSSQDPKTKVTEELDYLDSQIVDISNRLNDITLKNYMITTEEIQMGEKSSASSSGSSGSKNEESGNEQSQSSSQKEESSQSEKSNVTISSMEPKSILDLDDTNIDWRMIKNEIETINEAWSVIILDLTSVNADNNDILKFSTYLNDSLLSIKKENKQETLSNLTKLYSLIPKFEKQIDQNNGVQNVKQAKAYLINAYSLLEQDDWTGIENNVSSLDTTFKNVINDLEFIKNKEFKVNRTYVLIKELQNSLSYRDKKIFLVKYSNLMESINTI
ncbi:MAG: hypothetical protein J5507_03710 [Clostridia bacterium]|nr:hypothetical protein [Clostridia bacterium]